MPDWNTHFLKNPIFYLLQHDVIEKFTAWPDINALNKLLETNVTILTNSGIPLKFVLPSPDSYEFSIYLKGEVPTRKENWHDFFNAMIWFTFPKTKATINELQYLALRDRKHISQFRTPLENILTLFDENGAIVVSQNKDLLNLLKNFQWQELFWQRRTEVINDMQFFMFGHSLYEKALNPYIGMTASSILLLESEEFFNLDLKNQLAKLDILVSDEIKTCERLQPLPILGVPGWYAANQDANFYENKQYFRGIQIK